MTSCNVKNKEEEIIPERGLSARVLDGITGVEMNSRLQRESGGINKQIACSVGPTIGARESWTVDDATTPAHLLSGIVGSVGRPSCVGVAGLLVLEDEDRCRRMYGLGGGFSVTGDDTDEGVGLSAGTGSSNVSCTVRGGGRSTMASNS